MLDEFFEKLSKRREMTWDIEDLKSDYGDILPLFVYDNLRKGGSDNHILDGLPFFGTAVTQEDEFVMASSNSGPNPVSFYNEKNLRQEMNLVNSNIKRIEGEIYGIPLDMLYYLDKVYQNGHNYERVQIPILFEQPDSTRMFLIRNALIYLGNFAVFKKAKRAFHDHLRPYNYGKNDLFPHETVYRTKFT